MREKGESTIRLTLEASRTSDGLATGTRVCARTVSRTSPVTAKGDVEDDIVLLEVLYDVARIASGEERIGSTPGIGVRCALVHVVSDSLTSERYRA